MEFISDQIVLLIEIQIRKIPVKLRLQIEIVGISHSLILLTILIIG